MEPYPKPHLPIQAVLSGLIAIPYAGAKYQSILQANTIRYVTSGRIAIANALKHAGIKPGDKILIPAYHCTSMVEPVLWLKAKPVYYRVNTDTSVDLEDLNKKFSPDVRMLMVTHYFGFPQDMPALREFSDNKGLLLLEDCAHAFFGESCKKAVGTYGDYAICSIMKFFPVFDGGCLAAKSQNINEIKLESAGAAFQIKAALNMLEQAFYYNRLRMLKIIFTLLLKFKDYTWRQIKSNKIVNADKPIAPGASEGGYLFETSWLNKKMSVASRLAMLVVSKSRLTAKRRNNYLFLQQRLAGLEGIKFLFPELPDNVVPYVFPVLFDEPEMIFPVLKRQGVPIIRFGEFLRKEVDEQTCPVSVDLSRRLFQFPCHQDLTIKELNWMIEHIRDALAKNQSPVNNRVTS